MVELLQRADLTRCHACANLGETGVEAAVEPERDGNTRRRRPWVAAHRRARVQVDRLLAQHGDARLDGLLDEIDVRGGRRRDEHRVDVAGGEDLVGVVGHPPAEAFRDAACAFDDTGRRPRRAVRRGSRRCSRHAPGRCGRCRSGRSGGGRRSRLVPSREVDRVLGRFQTQGRSAARLTRWSSPRAARKASMETSGAVEHVLLDDDPAVEAALVHGRPSRRARSRSPRPNATKAPD